MKHGYTCSCGWHLNRADLTRREYAAKKECHAENCRPSANEIRQSRNLSPLDSDTSAPFSVRG